MKIKITVISLLTVTLFYSCSKDDGLPSPELEQFMYLSLAGAKNNPVVRMLEGESDTIFYISATYGGTVNYNQGDIEVQIEDELLLAESYNIANNTSYLPMPVDAWSIDGWTTKIDNGSNLSHPLNLTVKPSRLDLESEYILPLTIQSVNGGNLLLNEELKTLYLVFMSERDLLGKEYWEVIQVSSEWYEIFKASNMFDNDAASYWHTDLNGLPQSFTVDMKKIMKINGFLFLNRQDYEGNTANPKSIRFETSSDNIIWETVLQMDAPQIYEQQQFPLASPVWAQYFRVTAGSSWTGQTWTYIAELSIY